MKAQNVLHWFLILGHITFILTESSTSGSTTNDPEAVIEANDTSTAEKILDYLIENNDAVNFALKRGNNKRKQQQTDEMRDSSPVSLDEQINNRISSYLTKKNDKVKNVTGLELKVNGTKVELGPIGKENVLNTVVEKVVEKVPTPTLPPFFSNAYNRVVHLLGENKVEGGSSANEILQKPPKPSEAEILAMSGTTEKQKPLKLEDTINEIGSQLIGKLSTTKKEEVTTVVPSTTVSTTVKEEEVSTKAAPSTTTVEATTTPATTTTVKKKEIPSTTTRKTPIQKLGESVGGLLQRLGVNKGKTETVKPSIISNRVTYSYEIPITTLPLFSMSSTRRPLVPPLVSDVIPNNVIKEQTVESINSVQSFLQQFGVTINSIPESSTMDVPEEIMSDEESIRLPTTFRTTRRPYPWSTNKYRPSNDAQTAQTIPADFEELETTTRRIFPTWTKSTSTQKPTIRYPTRMPPANKISSELSDANLIDTDNQNTTMVKISVLNAGCQAEKSVLMLFNKNQKVLISIDSTDGSENQGVIVGHDDVKPVPTKRPNGVELEIDESAQDNTKLDDEEVTEDQAPGIAKPTKAPTKATTTKKLRATRSTRPPRTTTQRVRTTRARPTRRPSETEYDENDNVTSAPTKKKRRRTNANKKRKGNKNRNRKPAVNAIAIASSTAVPEVVSADPEALT